MCNAFTKGGREGLYLSKGPERRSPEFAAHERQISGHEQDSQGFLAVEIARKKKCENVQDASLGTRRFLRMSTECAGNKFIGGLGEDLSERSREKCTCYTREPYCIGKLQERLGVLE